MAVAKKTSKNQLTLPASVVREFPGVEYFDVRAESGQIVLTPVRPDAAERVREKLAQAGITEADVAAAVRWARKR